MSRKSSLIKIIHRTNTGSGRLADSAIDKRNLQIVRALMASHRDLSPKELFVFAFVLHHAGDRQTQFHKAALLAQRSHRGGFQKAGPLFASAFDRHLVATGRKQKYGTQYQWNAEHRSFRLLPTDGSASNVERQMLGLVHASDIAETLPVSAQVPLQGIEGHDRLT